jgi:hypothetical protein
VQDRSRLVSTPLGLLYATHRAPRLPDSGHESITTYTNSFLCFSIHKLAIKTASSVEIGRGQHSLTVGPQVVCGTKLEVLHLPFRSRAEILKRGLNYEPRRAMIREDRSISWQSAFFGEVVASGILSGLPTAAIRADRSTFMASRSRQRKITGFKQS